MKHKVAVYGTLKKGYPNSHLLDKAEFLGKERLTSLTLYDLGAYPGARLKSSGGVLVEIYAVNDQILEELDILEDYIPSLPDQSLYLRKSLGTRFGLCWVYIYNQPVSSGQVISSGNW
ncbi:MAG: gamma-glutamylcyclotransferase family protein [Marinobacter sp.]|nr:gamma-glutamylcyclotransferase family protein [Marinobacter sp.]